MPCLPSCTTLSHAALCPNRSNDPTLHPPVVALGDYVDGMSVTVTLAFSDESHREAFLRAHGLVTRGDYRVRRGSQNLIYTIKALDGDGRPIDRLGT